MKRSSFYAHFRGSFVMAVISNEKLQSQWKVFWEIRIWARLLHTRTSLLWSSIIFYFVRPLNRIALTISVYLSKGILHRWRIFQRAGKWARPMCVQYQINTTRRHGLLVRWQNDCAKVFSMHILTTISSSIFVLLHFVSVISAGSDHEKTQISKSIKL